MRNCFIPHCDAYCKQHKIEKRMMFMPPKDEEIFNMWKEKLFNKRPFKYTDKVCERHFTKDAILTHWDHVIQGERVQLKRDKPKLREKTIPTLNLPDFLDISASSEKDITLKQKNRPIKSRDRSGDKLSDIKEEPIKRRKKASDAKLESFTIENDGKNIKPVSENDLNEMEKDTAEENQSKAIEIEDNPEKLASFDCICDDIFEVILPSTLWGIHRDPDNKFVVFSMFDINTMSNSKLLYVSNQFEIKILLYNKLISQQILDELSIEILSNLLNDLEDYRLCAGNKINKCELLALHDQNYCSKCVKINL